MDCDKIQSLIPGYFNHTASEEEIKVVEEHLCICHNCRTLLGELMDKEAFTADVSPAKDDSPPQAVPRQDTGEIQYFPAKDFDEILKKPPEPIQGYANKESPEDAKDDAVPIEYLDESALSEKKEPESSDIEYINNFSQDGPVQAPKKDSDDAGIGQMFSLDNDVPLPGVDEDSRQTAHFKDKKPSESSSEARPAPEPISSDIDQPQSPDNEEAVATPEPNAGKRETTPGKRVIQTPLGPISLNDDFDEESLPSAEPEVELPSELAQDKSQHADEDKKVIQTPLGPISLPDNDDQPAALRDSTEKRAPTLPAGSSDALKPDTGLSDDRQEAEFYHPEPEKVVEPVKDDPIYSGEHSDMAGGESVVRSPTAASSGGKTSYELDQVPIAPESGAFNYAIIAAAVIIFIIVFYFFIKIKG